MTSPSYVSSATGTPSVPAEPPSLSQAMFIAPRTTQAPVSGVQKMAGLSAALNVLTLLSDPPDRAPHRGSENRIAVRRTAELRVLVQHRAIEQVRAGGWVKNILPPLKFWAYPSPMG